MRQIVTSKANPPKTLKVFIRPLGKIGRFLLLVIILPIYKTYLVIKKFITTFYAPQKSRHLVVHSFSRRYLSHFIIIVLAVFTIVANLDAYETRYENFEQNAMAATIITTEDLGGIEEEGPIIVNKKITKYLGQTGVSNNASGIEGDQTQDITQTTVAGNSAIIQQILSPVEEGLRQRDKVVTYTVQASDTISEIAEKFGVTVNTILWQNNLSAYTLIRPGDTLTILPTSGILHKVAKGDTLAGIAKKYTIDADKIIDSNKLASANDLQIGEQLLIPGGAKIIPVPTYTVRSFTQPVAAPVAKVASGSGDMIWPTNCRRITQYFRYGHTGVDIACSYGTPIYAADGGTVVTAQGGWNGGYGVYIIIDHGGGKQSLYGHNSSLNVKVGDTVTKGQYIASMGSTGRSTGPHLHFEIRVSGSRNNPLYYIK